MIDINNTEELSPSASGFLKTYDDDLKRIAKDNPKLFDAIFMTIGFISAKEKGLTKSISPEQLSTPTPPSPKVETTTPPQKKIEVERLTDKYVVDYAGYTLEKGDLIPEQVLHKWFEKGNNFLDLDDDKGWSQTNFKFNTSIGRVITGFYLIDGVLAFTTNIYSDFTFVNSKIAIKLEGSPTSPQSTFKEFLVEETKDGMDLLALRPTYAGLQIGLHIPAYFIRGFINQDKGLRWDEVEKEWKDNTIGINDDVYFIDKFIVAKGNAGIVLKGQANTVTITEKSNIAPFGKYILDYYGSPPQGSPYAVKDIFQGLYLVQSRTQQKYILPLGTRITNNKMLGFFKQGATIYQQTNNYLPKSAANLSNLGGDYKIIGYAVINNRNVVCINAFPEIFVEEEELFSYLNQSTNIPTAAPQVAAPTKPAQKAPVTTTVTPAPATKKGRPQKAKTVEKKKKVKEVLDINITDIQI